MESKKPFRFPPLFVVLLAVMLGVGCAGGPGSLEPPPDWVLTLPADDGQYSYFVGYGTSTAGDSAEAREIATNTLLDEILRYIGVRVTAETTAEARGSLDDFKADITQVVKQTGAAKITGFTIADSWTDRSGEPSLTIYILGRYDREELQKEKNRIERLFIEEDEAISIPERDGKSLSERGRYYEAAIKFIAAAGAALKSTVANADIKYKRNMDQAMEAVEGVSLVKLNDNMRGKAGEPLPEPLVLKIVNGSAFDDPGIPDATFIVTYQEFHKPSAKMRYKEAEVKSDEEGLAGFEHPIPQFVGSATVSFSLDLSSYLRVLYEAKGSDRDLVDGLEELLVRKKTTFKIDVASDAQNIRTGVFITAYDGEDNPADSDQALNALLSTLSDYDLTRLELQEWEGKSESSLLTELEEVYGGKVKRIIIGSVRIVESKKSDGKFLAKASGSVKVVEISSGELLWSGQVEKSGLGNTEKDAGMRAYQEVGKLLGQKIRNNLL